MNSKLIDPCNWTNPDILQDESVRRPVIVRLALTVSFRGAVNNGLCIVDFTRDAELCP
jgi:hypothetical protein